ncbi:MAG: hypothetical protein IKI47_01800, partial [Prevotella sp.]|nr:hypothetical protein [Prevotella sp.]
LSPTKFLVTLRNDSPHPALMLRLNLKADDGEQILPVIYSDNYFHLMPSEQQTVSIEWNERDARGRQAEVEVSGYNVAKNLMSFRKLSLR